VKAVSELRLSEMTDDQRACFDVLELVFYGAHHVPKVQSYGKGIKVNVFSGKLATFDFDYLTRLVVLCHDACVRAEIVQGGPGNVGIVLHKRHVREGRMNERHPRMEDAIAAIRPQLIGPLNQ
jgi:hypothetical protein